MAAGLNPCEVYFRENLLTGAHPPYIPGGDLSGYVEQVGEGVTKFKVLTLHLYMYLFSHNTMGYWAYMC